MGNFTCNNEERAEYVVWMDFFCRSAGVLAKNQELKRRFKTLRKNSQSQKDIWPIYKHNRIHIVLKLEFQKHEDILHFI